MAYFVSLHARNDAAISTASRVGGVFAVASALEVDAHGNRRRIGRWRALTRLLLPAAGGRIAFSHADLDLGADQHHGMIARRGGESRTLATHTNPCYCRTARGGVVSVFGA
jgi:hypothetical protein